MMYAKYVIRAEYVTNVKTMMVKTMNNTFTIERRIPFLLVNTDSIDHTYKGIMYDVVREIAQGPHYKIKDFLYRFEFNEGTEDGMTGDYIIRATVSIHHITHTEVTVKPLLQPKKKFFERLSIGFKYIFGMR